MKNNISNQTNNIVIVVLFLVYIFMTGVITLNNNIYRFKNAYRSMNKKEEFKNADFNDKYNFIKTNYENIFISNLAGKYQYIDIYGRFQKIMLKNIVDDVDYNKRVIKLSNDSLTFIYPKGDTSNWENKVIAVSDYAKSEGVYMLYVNAPWRIDQSASLPFYIKDNVNDTSKKFINKLKKRGVNTLELKNHLEGNADNWFFKTDHHWNIETAFDAYKIIMQEINDEVDIELKEKYLNDYATKSYENIFLGTYGKRVGKYFGGIDNYKYILPKFATLLEVKNFIKPGKEDSHLTGSFKNVFTYPEYIINDELDREMSTYYTYGEGTKAEVRINNLKAYNNKKVLIFKDSFADPVYPFVSLNFKETRVLDIRNYAGLKVYKYIEKYNPDVILFIHTPTSLYNNSLVNFKLK